MHARTRSSALFPEKEPFSYLVKQEKVHLHLPLITREELLRTNKRIGNSKAPGMDNIPNGALKTAVNAIPQTFLDMSNTCLAEETFPERCKRQRPELLSKGNKPPEESSSYRPLCMLDSSEKTLECFIFNRIEAATGHLLADN